MSDNKDMDFYFAAKNLENIKESRVTVHYAVTSSIIDYNEHVALFIILLTDADGFREGFSEGQELALQSGFNDGYGIATETCYKLAKLKGFLSVVTQCDAVKITPGDRGRLESILNDLESMKLDHSCFTSQTMANQGLGTETTSDLTNKTDDTGQEVINSADSLASSSFITTEQSKDTLMTENPKISENKVAYDTLMTENPKISENKVTYMKPYGNMHNVEDMKTSQGGLFDLERSSREVIVDGEIQLKTSEHRINNASDEGSGDKVLTDKEAECVKLAAVGIPQNTGQYNAVLFEKCEKECIHIFTKYNLNL